VFQAIVDSSLQQMRAYDELLAAVAKSVDEFARDTGFERDLEEASEARIRLRSGASMPGEAALRAGLGLEPGERCRRARTFASEIRRIGGPWLPGGLRREAAAEVEAGGAEIVEGAGGAVEAPETADIQDEGIVFAG
jgi:hypothetical protein